MDYFERAHVVKIKEAKANKGQTATKKQFKLMLHGYKTSDNDLIKESVNIKVDLDESSSVSGFSDLNLTVSSDDEMCNSTKNYESNSTSDSELDDSTPTSNRNEMNESNLNSSTSSFNADESFNDTTASGLSPNTDEAMTSASSSVSGYDEDNSFLNNISIVGVNSPISTDESNISSIDSLSESNLSEFDPNGELALQIHKKLQSHKQKNGKQEEQIKHEKRKVVDCELFSIKSKKSRQGKKCQNKKINDKAVEYVDQEDSVVSNAGELQAETTANSSFISIKATDLEEESFNHILGDYKHSTIRNLPSDNQSTWFSTDSTFPNECLIADVNIRNIDEVSSLIPEVDNDLSVSDLVDTDTNSLTTLETDMKEIHMTDSLETCTPLEEPNNYEQNTVNYKVYYGKKNCVIVLRHPAELYIHGKVIVKALGGSVEVFGHTLTDTECPIIAPLYTFAQCLKTIKKTNDYQYLYSKIKETGITFEETEEIVVNVGEYDGIILLKPMECPKMDFVAQNFNTNLFKSNNYKEKGLDKAGALLRCSLYSTRPQKFFQENPLWERILPNNDSPKIGITCGGKGSGKSTFVRYYVNRLLKKGSVLVIDLDPGQSEFTVAGNVSATLVDKPIFGPSFSHLRKSNMCLNIGIISTMDNIQRYVNAVKSIISYSKDKFSSVPWIINTMGMTNAVGLKFMALIIALVQPDFVLQYDSRNAKKRFDIRLTAANVTDLLRKYKSDKILLDVNNDVSEYSLIMAPEAEILAPNKSSLLPRDERYLSFLAYFAQLAAESRNEKSGLLGITPYEVSLKDLYVAVNVRLKDNCISKVINGKVVALCQQTTQCNNTRVFTLGDKPLLCHGHGLIRGIDWQHEVIYVVTPLSGNELRLVNTLVYADWVPELRGQEVYLSEGTKIPYRTTAQNQQTKLMAVPKRRFNPLQLLKMTRDS